MLDEACILRELRARDIEPDASQRSAILAILELLGVSAGRKWWRKSKRSLGVYCHGFPGRGKSVVVDTIFSLADCSKRRIHFHEFLREIIRRQVSAPTKDSDRLVASTKEWISGVELLCFDEFHVHDIADAFLIGRFLDTALSLGVRVVLTSNYAPDGLLPNPLFHQRFQPTIDRIKRHFNVIHFDGACDYRLKSGKTEGQRFFASLNQHTTERLHHLFQRCEETAPSGPMALLVAGRTLQARAAGQVMLWADFDALCVASRSHLDYLELAERWHGLIIDNLHVHQLASPSALQRFIWLIDIFYDRKHALLIASDHPLEHALSQLNGVHDLSRTLSRLAEIQSRSYADAIAWLRDNSLQPDFRVSGNSAEELPR